MPDYLLLVLGLGALIKGADWLVRGASSIARSLQVSDFVIGLTVVSFGTSLPELVIGLVAGAKGSPDIVIGNVIGSNIANVCLVLGVSAMIFPLKAMDSTIKIEIPFTVVASLVLAILLNDVFGDPAGALLLSRTDGILLLLCFLVFIGYVANAIRSDKTKEWVGEPASDSLRRSLLGIGAGFVGLVVGGQLTVTSATSIATAWGMSEVFIGLTIVAIGTSLPELATSAVAAYRKNADIAVGNVVGSNIFNIFIVLGITSLVTPVPYNASNNVDLMVMIGVTVLLFVSLSVGWSRRFVSRREGAFFVLIYAVYMVYLVQRG